MLDRVMVYDGDIGEILSDVRFEEEFGFSNCDINDTVLEADAYIVIAKNGWEILGADDDGDIRVRRVSLKEQSKLEERLKKTREFWQY
jgi:hypothetical protein